MRHVAHWRVGDCRAVGGIDRVQRLLALLYELLVRLNDERLVGKQSLAVVGLGDTGALKIARTWRRFIDRTHEAGYLILDLFAVELVHRESLAGPIAREAVEESQVYVGPGVGLRRVSHPDLSLARFGNVQNIGNLHILADEAKVL